MSALTVLLEFSNAILEVIAFIIDDIVGIVSSELIGKICKCNVLMIRRNRDWVVNGCKRTAS